MPEPSRTAPAIRSRKPTGLPPLPLLLIEGEPKGGKSLSAAKFATSEKVGVTYWLDLGEGSGDEYGCLPGSRIQVIEHSGQYRDILAQVTAVYAEARRAANAGEKPVVLVIDTMSALWGMLVDWTVGRAQRSKSGQSALRADPDAEVRIPMNLWNDANSRHRAVMDLLMTFPGIVIMIARGKEVAEIDDRGRPIEGSKVWKVEGQKNLPFDASAWVRLVRDPYRAYVVGARSLKLQVPEGKPLIVPSFSIEKLVFDLLGVPETAAVRDLQHLTGDDPDDPKPAEEVNRPARQQGRQRPAPEQTYDRAALVATLSEQATVMGMTLAESVKRFLDARKVADLDAVPDAALAELVEKRQKYIATQAKSKPVEAPAEQPTLTKAPVEPHPFVHAEGRDTCEVSGCDAYPDDLAAHGYVPKSA